MSKLVYKLPYKLLNFYPPFLGAGIRLKYVSKDKRRFVVSMKQYWFNKNIYGTHFGGSLYAMCDPFFIFILHAHLGNSYIYWVKAGKIEYLKPAKGKVRAVFEISSEKLNFIKNELDKLEKNNYTFSTSVTNKQNEIVAKVEIDVYIRKVNDNQKA